MGFWRHFLFAVTLGDKAIIQWTRQSRPMLAETTRNARS